jgi:hypothetical protein
MSTSSASRPAVRLRPLTLVDEGTEYIVGDPETGTFINVPPVGAVVIRTLQRGASFDEAAAAAERYAGEPVDLGSFLEALDEVGFTVPGGPAADSAAPAIRRSAPIQQGRWMTGPDPKWMRPLFSPAAWVAYAAAFSFSVVSFVLDPALFPRPHDAFVSREPGPGVLVIIPLSYALVALHECWHWLAARAAGVDSRFGVDRRLCFLVFETDLSQLWTLPRRRRYGPQLAGPAIDSLILASLLAFRLLREAHHPAAATSVLDELAAALILVVVMQLAWQSMIFLRTDLYGVLVTWTGCYDLWAVKSLMLRRAFRRLPDERARLLAEAHPRDLAVGRWFRWLYLAGIPAALAYYAAFFVPILTATGQWSLGEMAAGPAQARFWIALATAICVYAPPALVIAVWCRGRPHSVRVES